MMKRQLVLVRDFFRADYSYFLFITAVSFAILAIIAFVAGLVFPEIAVLVMKWFSEAIMQAGIMDDGGAMSAILLMLNNLRAMLLSMCYGFVPFLYVPVVSLGLNAMLLGLFAAVYVNAGQSMLIYLLGIVPHGIFEIPAMILSLSGGFYLCSTITRYVRTNEKGIVGNACKNLLRLFIVLCVPLIIVAAIVEAYITPIILQAVM